jgi:phage/plasmid-associated DNA primase
MVKSETQSIIEFCNKNDIKWFPIKLKMPEKIPMIIKEDCYYSTTIDKKTGQEKDCYIPKQSDFDREKGYIGEEVLKQRQELVDQYEYIAIDTHKIQQIDCDSEKAKEHFMNNDYTKYKPYFLSVNKKLPHIFVRFQQKYDDMSDLLINNQKRHEYYEKDENGKTIDDGIHYDLLTGQWSYVRKDTIVYNTHNKKMMIDKETEKIVFPEIFQEYKPKKQQKEKQETNKKEKQEEKQEEVEVNEETVKKVLKKISQEKKQQIKEIKDEKEKEIKKRNYKKTTEIIEKIINTEDDKFKELKAYLECLKPFRFEEYTNYLKLTTIVKSNYGEESFETYDNICKNYKGYKKNDNIKIWQSVKSEKISLGTLLFWCKEDDFNKYSEIIVNKYKDLTISDNFCCEILSLINQNIIWKDGNLYYYDGKIWRNGEYAMLMFKDFIDNDLYNYINLHILSCHTKTGNIQKLISQLNRIQKQSGKKDIIETSKQHKFKFNKDDDETVEFNKDWFLFPMKSKVYNLLTEEFEDYTREMYITETCGYDYVKPKEQIDIDKENKIDEEFDNLLNKIFTNEEIKRKFLMICSTGLENRLNQKIHFFTGCGGNGKSLLCDYLNAVYSKLYKSADTEIITLNGKKDDVKLAEISNKRVVMFPEPDKTQKINAGIMRKITGEAKLNARFLYQNGTEKKNVGTYIVCSNSMPTLSAEPEVADARRFEIIPFKSLFTQEKHLIDHKQNIFEADVSLLQKAEYFRNSFLKKLFESHKEYKKNGYKYNVIEEGEQLKKKYFEKSMTLINFLNEYFDFTESDEDIITFKQIYDFFKECDMTKQLTKEERRKYNRNGFEEYFESNIYYKSRYVKKHKKFNQAVLIKLKPKAGYEDNFICDEE